MRLPGERPQLPIMDGLAFHPYARQLGPVARHASPEVDHDRPRRLRPPDPDPRRRVRRDRPGRLVAPRPLRRVRRRIEDPRRQGEGVHGRRAGDDEAGRRDHAGAVLRTGACSSRSASRTSPASSCSIRRTSPRSRAGSPASTTPTGRRSRACTPCASASSAPVAARSPTATGSGSTSPRPACDFPTQAELRARLRAVIRFTCVARLRLGAAGRRAASTGATRARLTGYGRAGVATLASLKGRKLGSGRDQVLAHAHATRSIPGSRRRVRARRSASGCLTRVTSAPRTMSR